MDCRQEITGYILQLVCNFKVSVFPCDIQNIASWKFDSLYVEMLPNLEDLDASEWSECLVIGKFDSSVHKLEFIKIFMKYLSKSSVPYDRNPLWKQ